MGKRRQKWALLGFGLGSGWRAISSERSSEEKADGAERSLPYRRRRGLESKDTIFGTTFGVKLYECVYVNIM